MILIQYRLEKKLMSNYNNIPGNPTIIRKKSVSNSGLWSQDLSGNVKQGSASHRRSTTQGNITLFVRDSSGKLEFYRDEYGIQFQGKVRHYAKHSCVDGTRKRVIRMDGTDNCYLVK